MPSKFLIDGIDRLGKSTLINNIMNELGYHQVIHFDKPVSLAKYNKPDYLYHRKVNEDLQEYQFECNINMFKMIHGNSAKIIFDRTHLGEMVYASKYRGYDGKYIYDIEKNHDTSDSRLILLITTDFSFQKDDGESFDWSERVNEQQDFINAFLKSNIKDKVIIDVNNGRGGYKKESQILAEALKINIQNLKYVI